MAGEKLPETDPLIGRMIGNYRVEKRLGAGGMGSVYRLCHVELPQTYQALKVLAAGLSQETADRFKQEAIAAAAVGSHRVVRPLDKGQFEDGTPYIIMEYVDGRSLAEELVKCGALPVETALKIAFRIADTMTLAHQKGIIHRDLKPQNIMLTTEGQRDFVVKVLDFGVARTSGALRLVQTNRQIIVGTPGYMSPEAATGLGTDGRTDVFSLAVILFQMLAGELPFPPAPAEDGYQASVLRLLQLPPPTIASCRRPQFGPVPLEVEMVVARGLAKEPAQRYSMAELQGWLLSLLQQLGMSGDGVVRSPVASMLSTAADLGASPTSVPTLSTPSGEVAALIDRVKTPAQPARTVELRAPKPAAHRTEAPAEQVPASGMRGRRPLIIALTLAVSASVIGYALYLGNARHARPADHSLALPVTGVPSPPPASVPAPSPPPAAPTQVPPEAMHPMANSDRDVRASDAPPAGREKEHRKRERTKVHGVAPHLDDNGPSNPFGD